MTRPTEEHKMRQVAFFYEQGLSDPAIERATGVSDSVIMRWRKRNGLKANYWKHKGMPAPYTRENFDSCFDFNKHMQAWFAEVGAETHDEKAWALMCARKCMVEAR